MGQFLTYPSAVTLEMLKGLLWVISRRSQAYHAKVRFRALTGHSASKFEESQAERLLSPIADAQNG